MADDNPSIISHVSLGTNDLERAGRFYDAVLAAISSRRVMEHEGAAIAYGKSFPEFWVGKPFDGGRAEPANGVHIGFLAEVDAFHRAALDAGGTSDGEPGPRPMYGKPYYGCFVRDPDGHKVEAMFWDEEMAES